MVPAESDKVTLTKNMQVLRRAPALLAGRALTGAKLASDELIEDRRAEARSAAGGAKDRPRRAGCVATNTRISAEAGRLEGRAGSGGT